MLGCLYCAQAYLGQAAPARIYWGVHSVTRADADTDTPGKTFFEVLAAQAGSPPEFWGRYIGGFNHPEWELTKDEVRYLHSKNCRIVLVYRGTAPVPSTDPPKITTRQHGIDHANRAIDFASRLGVPIGKKVWILRFARVRTPTATPR